MAVGGVAGLGQPPLGLVEFAAAEVLEVEGEGGALVARAGGDPPPEGGADGVSGQVEQASEDPCALDLDVRVALLSKTTTV
ncbi:hypothetical protein ACIRRH_40295 [Kitasatospora sp. NPDC101235]|uniref:hypothetical protein n=1 Tax=Kitasatospora sp. NPDC101235 TaxID=3364101 RepID=UPI00382B88D7